MIDIKNTSFFLTILLVVSSCSQILENVEVGKFPLEQVIEAEKQDEFVINLKTLTLAEANKSKLAPYARNVMVSGSGSRANLYPESNFLKNNLPINSKKIEYKLGVGDEITFVQLQEANTNLDALNIITTDQGSISGIVNQHKDDKLISSKGRIGSDGSVLLLGLGRLEANGRSIQDLRTEVRNIIIRKGLVPNFQLEITRFESRSAYVYGPDGGNGVVPITERPITLRELAARFGFKEIPNFINVVTLKRGGENYKLNSEDILDDKRKEIIIQDKDQIILEAFPYKPGQVYALSGAIAAATVPINPSQRETMADVMFVKGGPFSNQFAKKSDVYLLRGTKPITAYHLDAQSASRIIVAAAMELRPDDIIFVAERPIISFSRVLQEITPLRFLLRDIQSGNIP
jgi:polysaccharide biosynthesis/export protein